MKRTSKCWRRYMCGGSGGLHVCTYLFWYSSFSYPKFQTPHLQQHDQKISMGCQEGSIDACMHKFCSVCGGSLKVTKDNIIVQARRTFKTVLIRRPDIDRHNGNTRRDEAAYRLLSFCLVVFQLVFSCYMHPHLNPSSFCIRT